MSFSIKTDAFEGPLDLLLSLVEKRKLFINDIALAQVADSFIEHIKRFEKFPIEDSADFILIASTLLLIKSKSLLPQLSLTEEEEQGIHDLETRLKIYKRIKEASQHVAESFGHNPIFMPSQARPSVVIFSPHPTMTLARLGESIMTIVRSLPKKELLPKVVVRQILSLEEVIVSLTDRITKGLKMSFKEFTNSHEAQKEKVNVIVSFLAMLELVKQGIIHVSQESTYGDIHMETKEISVPRYN